MSHPLSERQAIYIMNRTKSALVEFAKQVDHALADGHISFWEGAGFGTALVSLTPLIQGLISNLDTPEERHAFIKALEHLEFSLPHPSTVPTDLFN